MKLMQWQSGVQIMICFSLLFFACDEILNQIDTFNITIEEEIISDDVFAEPTDLPLIQGARIGGEGSLAKLLEAGFIEREIDGLDLMMLHSLLNDNGAWLSGSVTNEAGNGVVFSIYGSTISGLADPTTAALLLTTPIASLASIQLEDFTTMASTLAALLSTIDVGTLYLYFYAEGDPDVDVTITNIALNMHAAAHVHDLFQPGDYAQYRESLQEVIDGEIQGIIRNNGTGAVHLQIYVSDEIRPTLRVGDLLVDEIIAAGSSLDLAGELVGDALDTLMDRIDALIASGTILYVDVLMTSTASISVRLDDIRITATATVSS